MRKPPPVLRYVYSYPALDLTIVQHLHTLEVISIVTEEYEYDAKRDYFEVYSH